MTESFGNEVGGAYLFMDFFIQQIFTEHCCVPGINLCAEYTVENRANKVPVVMDFMF